MPRERADRMRVARLLVAAALADPAARRGEGARGRRASTRPTLSATAIPDLLATLAPLPPNLVVSTESMARALDTAEGLVTVSSTAAIEAVARGIPVIALDTFGVDDKLINPVFLGSGLFGSEEDVIARQFRPPAASVAGAQLLPRSRRGRLDRTRRRARRAAPRRRAAAKPARARRGGRARDAWERKLALGQQRPLLRRHGRVS